MPNDQETSEEYAKEKQRILEELNVEIDNFDELNSTIWSALGFLADNKDKFSRKDIEVFANSDSLKVVKDNPDLEKAFTHVIQNVDLHKRGNPFWELVQFIGKILHSHKMISYGFNKSIRPADLFKVDVLEEVAKNEGAKQLYGQFAKSENLKDFREQFKNAVASPELDNFIKVVGGKERQVGV